MVKAYKNDTKNYTEKVPLSFTLTLYRKKIIFLAPLAIRIGFLNFKTKTILFYCEVDQVAHSVESFWL